MMMYLIPSKSQDHVTTQVDIYSHTGYTTVRGETLHHCWTEIARHLIDTDSFVVPIDYLGRPLAAMIEEDGYDVTTLSPMSIGCFFGATKAVK